MNPIELPPFSNQSFMGNAPDRFAPREDPLGASSALSLGHEQTPFRNSRTKDEHDLKDPFAALSSSSSSPCADHRRDGWMLVNISGFDLKGKLREGSFRHRILSQ